MVIDPASIVPHCGSQTIGQFLQLCQKCLQCPGVILRIGLQCLVEVIHIGFQMLIMVKMHGRFIHIRLQSIIGIRQRRKRERIGRLGNLKVTSYGIRDCLLISIS